MYFNSDGRLSPQTQAGETPLPPLGHGTCGAQVSASLTSRMTSTTRNARPLDIPSSDYVYTLNRDNCEPVFDLSGSLHKYSESFGKVPRSDVMKSLGALEPEVVKSLGALEPDQSVAKQSIDPDQVRN